MGEPRDYAAWLEVGDGVDKMNEAAAEVRRRRYRRWGSVAEWRRGRG